MFPFKSYIVTLNFHLFYNGTKYHFFFLFLSAKTAIYMKRRIYRSECRIISAFETFCVRDILHKWKFFFFYESISDVIGITPGAFEWRFIESLVAHKTWEKYKAPQVRNCIEEKKKKRRRESLLKRSSSQKVAFTVND